MPATKKIEVRAIAHGKVQGVGFRATVLKYARQSQLTGYVTNLPNGDVEMVVQGTEDQVQQFFQNLETKPGSAKVNNWQRYHNQSLGSYQTFQIV